MEQNLPVCAKRIWETVRVIFFMLRKGISKRKLLLDLNLMLKRGNKIATKAKSIRNLMFQYYHHNHHGNHHLDGRSGNSPPSDQEYEFSCSSTPAYSLPGKKSRHQTNHSHSSNNNFFSCAFHAPPTLDDDVTTVNAVKMALDMLQNNNNEMISAEASPCPYPYPSLYPSPSPARMMLPGFGRSPMVRQLRITDSPFPLRDEGDNGVVDKKAEEFIEKFYKELRKQKSG